MARSSAVVVALALVALSACAPGGASAPEVRSAPGQEAAVEHALDASPVPQRPGSGFVIDRDAVWLASGSALARLDRRSGRWTKHRYGVRSAQFVRIDAGVPGVVRGIILACDGVCDDEGGRLTAHWFVAGGNGIQDSGRVDGADIGVGERFDAVGDPSPSTSEFLVGNHLVGISDTGVASVTALPTGADLVCHGPNGYVVVQDLPVAQGSLPVPPDQKVLVGRSASSLTAIDGGIAGPLLRSAESGSACLGDGLAIIGPSAAFEFSLERMRWVERPADIGISLERQRPRHPPVADAEGRVWVAGSVVANLLRDDTGWHLADRASSTEAMPTAYAIDAGHVVRYPSLTERRQTAHDASIPAAPAATDGN